jgi:hypothetical protein
MESNQGMEKVLKSFPQIPYENVVENPQVGWVDKNCHNPKGTNKDYPLEPRIVVENPQAGRADKNCHNPEETNKNYLLEPK